MRHFLLFVPSFEATMPNTERIAALEAIMPLNIPMPRNVPRDQRCESNPSWACEHTDIRIRTIHCQNNDSVAYYCTEHAYDALACPFSYREDLDAVLLFPYFLSGDPKPYTWSERSAIVTECPLCHDEVARGSLRIPDPVTSANGQVLRYDTAICRGCQTSWYTSCQQCGQPMRVNDDEDSHDSTCPACARFRLHGSKRKPKPVFFKIEKDKEVEGDTGRFTGAEIELEFKYDQDRNSLVRKLLEPLPMELMHAETDGSLRNGIEFVTMPFSAEYLAANIGYFSKFYSDAAGYADHNATALNAGLHVHMTRKVITPRDAERMESLVCKKGLMSRYLLSLTKRSPDRLNQWAKLSPDPTVIDHLKRSSERPSSDRYRFLNWTKNTVECRGFAGSVDIKHFLTATQFVRALHDFVRSDAYDLKCSAFRKFIANSEYDELAASDEQFQDPRTTSSKTDVRTEQRMAGEFNHTGRSYCLCRTGTEMVAARGPGIHGLDPSDYRTTVRRRISSAHMATDMTDPVSGHRFVFDADRAVAEIYCNDNIYSVPVTTNREEVIEYIRRVIRDDPSDCDVLCGAYVWIQLEQLNTLGMLETAESQSAD